MADRSPGLHPLADALKSSDSFTYDRLDSSVNGIRLVVLEPSLDPYEIARCSLKHVTFSQKPKYEALSYTWGSQTENKVNILINGKLFAVGHNLWEALRDMRSSTDERILWIDAICINQANITERNEQLRIMPHIYTRAQSVAVWLGSFILDPPSTEVSEENFVSALCCREYWNRVWIIQEIGKARKIRIFYGRNSLEWKKFTYLAERYARWNEEVAASVPPKLVQQLQHKYDGGHKLHSLLKSYQNSLCTDPRDKIFGFVGLATDCDQKFPMDYGKRLFEVWRDAVIYKSNDEISPPVDILQLAQLMKRLLGGQEIASSNDLWRGTGHPYNDLVILDTSTCIRTPVLISGVISHLGPTHPETFSNLRKVDEWTSSIRKLLSKNSLPDILDSKDSLPGVLESNDRFLELLEELADEELKKISRWRPGIAYRFGSVPYPTSSELFPYTTTPPTLVSMKRNYIRPEMTDTVESAATEPRLFFLERNYVFENNNAATVMGLAPPGARVGDLICHIYESEIAVVVRVEMNLFTLIGTSVLAKNFAVPVKFHRGGIFAIPFDSRILNDKFNKLPMTFVYLDIPFVFNWSF
jgi:hypothetical protein